MLGIVLIFVLLQSLLFLDDDTLKGTKEDVYVNMKILKSCTNSKTKSFELKFAVDMELNNKNPSEMGMGPAIRLVMKHTRINGKFDDIHPELRDVGFTGVEVTDQGFKFVRSQGEF